MNKKVILINGSARKKNTYNILRQIEDILNNRGIETEILNLFDYEIKHCMGCEVCVKKSSCCLKDDDMPALMNKIAESDGIVLSSPVYMCGVTSKLKSLADRLNQWIHKPDLAGKPMMFATTTASTGIKETQKFFDSFAAGLCVRKGDFIARTAAKLDNSVSEKEISGFLTLLEQDKKYYKPAMNEIVMFAVGKVLAYKSDGDDRRYWEEKEWLDKNYYYPCKMNPAKKLFSKFIFKIISKAMK